MIFNNPIDHIVYSIIHFNFGWFIASILICGAIWIYTIFVWMIIYQLKFGGNAGDDYFSMPRKEFHKKYRLKK